jgi:hypothetical protein
LPVILAQEEVARLIDCAPGPGLKYKAVLSVAYGAGLRVSEVAALKISDIDRERMLIRIPVPVASSRNGRLRLSLRADLYVAPSPTDEFIDAVAPRNEAESKDVVDRPREITPARLDAER